MLKQRSVHYGSTYYDTDVDHNAGADAVLPGAVIRGSTVHCLHYKRKVLTARRGSNGSSITRTHGYQAPQPRTVDSHHSRAFWNMRNHGDAFSAFFPSRRQSVGTHGHAHAWCVRSGCGMIARWRPSGVHRAAMPRGDPFGLNGYASVGATSSSTYCSGTRSGPPPAPNTASSTAASGKCARPSPCWSQTPSVEPAMPRSMIAGVSLTRTVGKRDSKRPDALCTKRG